MEDVYLLYSCNEHKEYSSMRLIAATADTNTLYAVIGNNIFEGNMEYDGESNHNGFIRFREDYRQGSINFDKLDYGFVNTPVIEKLFEYISLSEYEDAYSWLAMEDNEFTKLMSDITISDEELEDEYGEEI
jgi:hypothetical protein